jgi:hypothetical protein
MFSEVDEIKAWRFVAPQTKADEIKVLSDELERQNSMKGVKRARVSPAKPGLKKTSPAVAISRLGWRRCTSKPLIDLDKTPEMGVLCASQAVLVPIYAGLSRHSPSRGRMLTID